MSRYNRTRLARIDNILRMQEELSTLRRIEAEGRLSNIVRNQDALQQGEESIFSAMLLGPHARIAIYSVVDASEVERRAAIVCQGELKQLRGMRKVFGRISIESISCEEDIENEDRLQVIGFRAAYRHIFESS